MKENKFEVIDPEQWCARRVEYVVSGMFGGMRMSEIDIQCHRADMIFISDVGYITEVEIKISRSDWRADFKKSKWKNPERYMAYIKKFYYAAPEHIAKNPPPGIPECAGIISIGQRDNGYYFRDIIKKARIRKSDKIRHDMRIRWWKNYYYRFMNTETDRTQKLYAPKIKEGDI